MGQLLINLSNHPSNKWDEAQLEAAKQYGKILDISFPVIDPEADEAAVEMLATSYVDIIAKAAENKKTTVHLMGELTFCFALLNRLKELKYTCIASCSARNVVDLPDGRKQVDFSFVRFRIY